MFECMCMIVCMCNICTSNFRTNQIMFLQVSKTQERKFAASLELILQNLVPVTVAGSLTSRLVFSTSFLFYKIIQK